MLIKLLQPNLFVGPFMVQDADEILDYQAFSGDIVVKMIRPDQTIEIYKLKDNKLTTIYTGQRYHKPIDETIFIVKNQLFNESKPLFALSYKNGKITQISLSDIELDFQPKHTPVGHGHLFLRDGKIIGHQLVVKSRDLPIIRVVCNDNYLMLADDKPLINPMTGKLIWINEVHNKKMFDIKIDGDIKIADSERGPLSTVTQALNAFCLDKLVKVIDPTVSYAKPKTTTKHNLMDLKIIDSETIIVMGDFAPLCNPNFKFDGTIVLVDSDYGLLFGAMKEIRDNDTRNQITVIITTEIKMAKKMYPDAALLMISTGTKMYIHDIDMPKVYLLATHTDIESIKCPAKIGSLTSLGFCRYNKNCYSSKFQKIGFYKTFDFFGFANQESIKLHFSMSEVIASDGNTKLYKLTN